MAFTFNNTKAALPVAGGLAATGVGSGLALGAVGLGLLGDTANYFMAGNVGDQAQSQLNELDKQPLPQYAVTPQLQSLYRSYISNASTPQGFSGAQRSSFKQQLAQILNSRLAGATAIGGGQAGRTVAGMDVGTAVNANNTFANNDANLALQNKRFGYQGALGIGNTFQNVNNLNTNAAWNRRNMLENYYGQAIAKARGYQMNTVGNASQDLIGAGTIGLFGSPKKAAA